MSGKPAKDDDLAKARPHWPRSLDLLSALGLLPFLAALFLTVFPSPDLIETVIFERALIGYGALVLAFLCGVRWGVRLQSGAGGGAFYLVGCLGALLGAIALLLPVHIALSLLLIGFAVQGLWDVWTGFRGGLPAGYARLRVRMTLAVCFFLIAILTARVFVSA
jgi:hypothetical protein